MLKLVIALLAGTVIASAASQGLQAQSKRNPPVYVVTEISQTDPDGFRRDFVPRAQALLTTASGVHEVAVGAIGGPGGKVTGIDGEPPKRVVIQLWDSLEELQAYRSRADYIEAMKIGERYAKFRSYAVEGVAR